MARSLSLTVLAVLSASLSASVGCGGQGSSGGPTVEFDPCQPLALVADSGLSSTHVAGIVAGIAYWNTLVGTQLSLASPDAPTPATSVPIHFQPAAAPFHGLYDGPTAQIFINDDLADHAEAVVVAHEVGHAFGLVHISPSARASVMNPGNLAVEPTMEDAGTLQTRWGRCD